MQVSGTAVRLNRSTFMFGSARDARWRDDARAATPRETAKTEVAMRDIEVEEERVGKWISCNLTWPLYVLSGLELNATLLRAVHVSHSSKIAIPV